ncbi:MAG: alkaline phosphatase D family protein [Cyanobacteria bacterium]|nr:alkaline phosphatase D family protein [Cyanobacteriota bacterium]
MPGLVLGPLLRHAGAADATVWVETDGPCTIEILDRRSETFEVCGHHYGIVTLDGLAAGVTYPYAVALNGVRKWPDGDASVPPSVLRTIDPSAALRLMFGSCRVTSWQTRGPGSGPATDPGHGPDALRALATRLRNTPVDDWPHALILLGDQVYADEPSPRTLAFVRARRSTAGAHGEEVRDFEEYAQLYQEAWQEPHVRWLLSTVPTTMLWDDHDVHDDWNISAEWQEQTRAQPWWAERLTSAIMAYWVYQHLGNLSPAALAAEPLLAAARAGDGGAALRASAERLSSDPSAGRWSIARDFGTTRLLGVDCRSARALAPGARSMLPAGEWRWLEEQVRGDFDHLLIGLPDPYLLTPALHHLEAAIEIVCDGALGRRAAAAAEHLRQAWDLDHWAAFDASFRRLTALLQDVASGRYGVPPSTILTLSGDVHHCLLSSLAFPRHIGAVSRVYEAICSPLRNPLRLRDRIVVRLLCTRFISRLMRALARCVGSARLPFEWHRLAGPMFDNQIGTVELHGRSAVIRYERAVDSNGREPRLALQFEHQLSTSDARPTQRGSGGD